MSKLVIDIETTGTNPRKDKIHGIGLRGLQSEFAVYEREIRGLSETIYEDVIGHNVRFDAKFLAANGVKFRGDLIDTLALAQLIDENQDKYGLKALAAKNFGSKSLEGKSALDVLCDAYQVSHVGQLAAVSMRAPDATIDQTIETYCLEDVNNTKALYEKLVGQLETSHEIMTRLGFKQTLKDYWMQETRPLERVLAAMELRGIRIDQVALQVAHDKFISEEKYLVQAMEELCHDEIKQIEEDLYTKAVSKRSSTAGRAKVERRSDRYGTLYNWTSNAHVGTLIYEALASQVCCKTATGLYNVSEEAISQVKEKANGKLKEFVDLYSRYKKLQKLLNTYIGGDRGLSSHIEDGRIHPEFVHGGGPVTGRLACRQPNLQNLPREYPEVKRIFIPDPGHVFAYFDYSQIELRVAAHLSQDRRLVEGYLSSQDLHKLTASSIFNLPIDQITKEQRQVGKTINFATIYDASAYRLSGILEGYSVEECEKFRRDFFRLYQGYKYFLDVTQHKLKQDGYAVSMFGRVRRLPEIKTLQPGSKEYKHALKQGLNFIIQSAAASICKRAMIELHKKGYKIVNQIHDAVVIQLPLDQLDRVTEIATIAETVVTLSIPLKADVLLLKSFDDRDLYEG